MSNFKDGRWAGDRERETRNAYNRQWRKDNPNYMRDYHRDNKQLQKPCTTSTSQNPKNSP